MKQDIKELTINGTTYVPKGDTISPPVDGMPYKMVRTRSAGVFAGYVEKIESTEYGTKATLRQARRIFFWDGAASLSQLARDGTSAPQNCKFPCAVDSVELFEVIEMIPITEKAKASISGVKIWAE